MVRPLAIVLLVLAHSACAAVPCKEPLKGPPQYYTLALSWHPTLCLRFPDNPECGADQPRSTLVLHGLWPERRKDPDHCFAFCGVDELTKEKDKPKEWCGLPEEKMYEDVQDALYAVMPGHLVCLDRHEWLRHGKCSGLSINAYFGAAHDLAQRYLQSDFAAFLGGSDTLGRTVKREEVMAEFERRYGEGSRASMNLYCKKVGGVDYFNEISIYLAAPLKPEEPQLATPERDYQYGDCPSEFKIPFPGP